MARRLTYEEVKQYIENCGYELLSNEYINAHQDLYLKCNEGHTYKTRWNRFQQGHRCPECQAQLLSEKFRRPINEVYDLVTTLNYEFVKWIDKYESSNSKFMVKCKNGHHRETCYNYLTQTPHCPECNGFKRWTYKDVKKLIEVDSQSGCELLSKGYENYDAHLTLKCKCGEVFITTLNNIQSFNKLQCNDCGEKQGSEKQAHTYEYVKNFIEVESNSACKLLDKEYKNNVQKLKIQCGCGSIFHTSFAEFKSSNKRQCNKCSREKTSEKQRKDFSYISEYIKNNLSCMLLSPKEDYLNSKSELSFKCECGNIFTSTWGVIQRKDHTGLCKECINDKLRKERSSNIKDYKKRIKDIYQDEYIIIGSKYINARTAIPTLHKKCGKITDILPDGLIRKTSGCSYCNGSIGEREISNILEREGVYYKTEYTFPNCKYYKPLKFDFAVFNNKNNLLFLVEYDGEQHYRPVNFGGMSDKKAQREFESNQKRDQIKNNYCKDNNIPLLRIPYWEFDNIEAILEEWLGKHDLLHKNKSDNL